MPTTKTPIEAQAVKRYATIALFNELSFNGKLSLDFDRLGVDQEVFDRTCEEIPMLKNCANAINGLNNDLRDFKGEGHHDNVLVTAWSLHSEEDSRKTNGKSDGYPSPGRFRTAAMNCDGVAFHFLKSVDMAIGLAAKEFHGQLWDNQNEPN